MNEKNKLFFKIFSFLFGMMFLTGSVYQIFILFETPTQTHVAVEPLINEATAAIRANKYPEALAHLEKAKQIQEESETKTVDSNTYILLGEVNHKMGRLPDAVSHYLKALSYDNKHVIVHEELAVIYGKQKKFDLAEKELAWVLKQNPKNIYALNNMGVAYIQQNKLVQAEQILQQALAVRDDFVDTYRNLGFLYQMKKDAKQSKEYFEKYLRLAPTATDAEAIKKFLK